MWEIIVDIVVIWLLYKLIFDFIIPVYQSTRQVRKQVQDIRQHMQDYYQQSAPPQGRAGEDASPSPGPGKEKEGEYIDFEEVR